MRASHQLAFDPTHISVVDHRLIETSAVIRQNPPARIDFLHSVMCQVGLPRRRTEARSFERRNGHVSLLLEAGRLWDGQGWVDQPLPFGVTPRLVMVHVSSEAVRTRQRTVEIGQSVRQFLGMLGMQPNGGLRGGYGALKRQMEALAACRLTIGMSTAEKSITKDAKPFSRFEAWLHGDGTQSTFWPGVLELSASYFETLTEHAVPLDPRALAALKHSALSLDVYVWLAHRLCRVNREQGVKLSWANIREQFGQEYTDRRNFKREFRRALHQVMAVYPDARIGEVIGGLILFHSRAPLAKTALRIRHPA